MLVRTYGLAPRFAQDDSWKMFSVSDEPTSLPLVTLITWRH